MEMANLSPSRAGSSTPDKSRQSTVENATLESGAAESPVTGPFRGLGKDLGGNLLKVVNTPISDVNNRKILYAADTEKPYLPGQPRVRLLTDEPAAGNGATTEAQRQKAEKIEKNLHEYLQTCHLSVELDGILKFMKYIFVQTPSHRHIMALHHQEAHGRKVLVNENPGLHLIWYYERIFVKPIPAYFYSQAFWDYIAVVEPEVHAAAVGFMRSYYYLIQYEIDYHQACKLQLIPNLPSGEQPTYAAFCQFIAPFQDVDDKHVCRRYHYGELRLTRLNKTAMLFRGKLAYFHIHPQWGSYLSHILAPIITIFVVISVVLNSMQVTLQAIAGVDGMDPRWVPYVNVSAWFPVVVICMITFVIATAVFGIVVMGVKDLIWAKRVRQKKRGGDTRAGEKSHGMVW